jgi:hypothetical protein
MTSRKPFRPLGMRIRSISRAHIQQYLGDTPANSPTPPLPASWQAQANVPLQDPADAYDSALADVDAPPAAAPQVQRRPAPSTAAPQPPAPQVRRQATPPANAPAHAPANAANNGAQFERPSGEITTNMLENLLAAHQERRAAEAAQREAAPAAPSNAIQRQNDDEPPPSGSPRPSRRRGAVVDMTPPKKGGDLVDDTPDRFSMSLPSTDTIQPRRVDSPAANAALSTNDGAAQPTYSTADPLPTAPQDTPPAVMQAPPPNAAPPRVQPTREANRQAAASPSPAINSTPTSFAEFESFSTTATPPAADAPSPLSPPASPPMTIQPTRAAYVQPPTVRAEAPDIDPTPQPSAVRAEYVQPVQPPTVQDIDTTPAPQAAQAPAVTPSHIQRRAIGNVAPTNTESSQAPAVAPLRLTYTPAAPHTTQRTPDIADTTPADIQPPAVRAAYVQRTPDIDTTPADIQPPAVRAEYMQRTPDIDTTPAPQAAQAPAVTPSHIQRRAIGNVAPANTESSQAQPEATPLRLTYTPAAPHTTQRTPDIADTTPAAQAPAPSHIQRRAIGNVAPTNTESSQAQPEATPLRLTYTPAAPHTTQRTPDIADTTHAPQAVQPPAVRAEYVPSVQPPAVRAASPDIDTTPAAQAPAPSHIQRRAIGNVAPTNTESSQAQPEATPLRLTYTPAAPHTTQRTPDIDTTPADVQPTAVRAAYVQPADTAPALQPMRLDQALGGTLQRAPQVPAVAQPTPQTSPADNAPADVQSNPDGAIMQPVDLFDALLGQGSISLPTVRRSEATPRDPNVRSSITEIPKQTPTVVQPTVAQPTVAHAEYVQPMQSSPAEMQPPAVREPIADSATPARAEYVQPMREPIADSATPARAEYVQPTRAATPAAKVQSNPDSAIMQPVDLFDALLGQGSIGLPTVRRSEATPRDPNVRSSITEVPKGTTPAAQRAAAQRATAQRAAAPPPAQPPMGGQPMGSDSLPPNLEQRAASDDESVLLGLLGMPSDTPIIGRKTAEPSQTQTQSTQTPPSQTQQPTPTTTDAPPAVQRVITLEEMSTALADTSSDSSTQSAAAPNVDKIAQEVFKQLRAKLRQEYERKGKR